MTQARGPRVFQAQGTARGVVRIANTGNVPATFGVQVTPGADVPFVGFASEAPAVHVVTPAPVPAGGVAEIPVFVRLPNAPGLKVFRVVVGEVDRSGRIVRVLDEQLFSGLAEVAGAGIVPLPGEAPPPPVPSTEQRALEFRDSLGRPAVAFDPPSVVAGQAVRVALSVPTRATFPFRLRLSLFLVDAVGGEVRELVAPGEVTVAPAQTIRRDFSLDTSGLPAGSYGVRVFALDPASGMVVLDSPDLPGLLAIRPLEVAPPPARFAVGERVVLSLPEGEYPGVVTKVEEFREGEWHYGLLLDVGAHATGMRESWLSREVAPPVVAPVPPAAPQGLRPGDLVLLEPEVDRETVLPGESVSVALPFLNTGPVAPLVMAQVFVVGPQGSAVATLPSFTFSPAVGAETARSVQWRVPETAAPGSYGVQVFAWDPNSFVPGDPATYLVSQEVLNVFTVLPPGAAGPVFLV